MYIYGNRLYTKGHNIVCKMPWARAISSRPMNHTLTIIVKEKEEERERTEHYVQ